MSVEIFVGYPPDRASPRIAELRIISGDGKEFFAEVYEENGEVLIWVFAEDNSPWTFPMDDFRAALDRARIAATTPLDKT